MSDTIEKVDNRGAIYEQTVFKAVQKGTKLLHNVKPIDYSTRSASDSTTPDLDIEINGKLWSFEVKLDANAQMGGTSVRYMIYPTVSIDIVNKKAIDGPLEEDIITALKNKQREVKAFIDFVKTQSAFDKEKFNGLPSPVKKTSWNTAVAKGYLKPINTKIEVDINFIANHYNKKGIYYIQIGKSGLFYLNQNPLGLPIPKLSGKVILEMRATRAGSALNKTINDYVSGTGLRVQARLKSNGKSNFTLDNPEHALELFANIKK